MKEGGTGRDSQEVFVSHTHLHGTAREHLSAH